MSFQYFSQGFRNNQDNYQKPAGQIWVDVEPSPYHWEVQHWLEEIRKAIALGTLKATSADEDAYGIATFFFVNGYNWVLQVLRLLDSYRSYWDITGSMWDCTSFGYCEDLRSGKLDPKTEASSESHSKQTPVDTAWYSWTSGKAPKIQEDQDWWSSINGCFWFP